MSAFCKTIVIGRRLKSSRMFRAWRELPRKGRSPRVKELPPGNAGYAALRSPATMDRARASPIAFHVGSFVRGQLK